MNFFTKVSIKKTRNQISYNSKIVLMGSCFSENIGQKFEYFKFRNSINHFGIIFNPISIENLISRSLNEQFFTENDVFYHDELWKCFEVHSDLNCENKEQLINNLNVILIDFKNEILNASHLIITYGTSWVYRNVASQKIVANCHKAPQNQFNKEILSVEIIEKSIQNTVDLIAKFNPKCNLIFTISPVRHIKDGFIENTQSKSHLFAALNRILKNFSIPTSAVVEIFPSYEIMMDELRDYRFYAEDMLHPNKMAINYIWERFSETYFDQETVLITQEVDPIQKALLHRPFNTKSENHIKFIANLNSKIDTLSKKNPQILF